MVNKYYQKTKKSFKKKHAKDIKIFLKKKKKKGTKKKTQDRYKNFSEDEKQKKIEYREIIV